MSERRCHGCAGWYDTREQACPECGTPRHAKNSWLTTAKINSQLYAQAESAEREKRVERTLR